MKILIGALALILAAPVAAQTAPAGDPAQQQPAGAPAEHKMDCKCCDKMKQQGGKMECCDEHAEHAEHSGEHGSHSTQ